MENTDDMHKLWNYICLDCGDSMQFFGIGMAIYLVV